MKNQDVQQKNMRKNILLILFLLTRLNPALTQPKAIYRENFSDNKDNWKLYNDKDFKVQINNGRLSIQKFELNRKRNGCLWYHKEIPGFNANKNFSITFFAKILSLDDEFKSIDLQWGNLTDSDTAAQKKYNLYQVLINPVQISLASFNGQWTYFNSSTEDGGPFYGRCETANDFVPVSPLFKTDRFNKFEIEQRDGLIVLRLNNKTVFQRRMPTLTGSDIGIQQCVKSSWEISKIVIMQSD